MEPRADRHLSNAELAFLVDAGWHMETRPSPEEVSSWTAHVEACLECTAELQRIRAADAEFRRALDAVRPPSRSDASGCPDESVWALIGGEMAGNEAQNLIDHAIECSRCAHLLAAASEGGASEQAPELLLRSSTPEWQARMGRRLSRAAKPPTRLYWGVAMAAAAVLLVAVGAAILARRNDPDRLLAQAYAARRPFEFRLQQTAYGRVSADKGSTNPFQFPEPLREALRRIADELRDRPSDTAVLVRQAGVLLLTGHHAEALNTLEPLKRDPRVWITLACAHYLQAKTRAGAAQDYSESLELLLEARRQLGDSPVLLFDLALVFEALRQVPQAIETWDAYLKLDSESGFAGEARRHRQDLEKKLAGRGAVLDAVHGSASAFLGLPPEMRRRTSEMFLNVALADWLPHAKPGTPEHRAMETLAHEYTGETGDPFLKELPAADSGPAVEQLARAIHLEQNGDFLMSSEAAADAARRFSSRGSRAGNLRARLEQVYALHRSSQPEACLARAMELERDLRSLPYSWIAVQNQIEIAICLSHLGRLGSALERAAGASALAAGARLPSLELRARTMTADFLLRTGADDAFWREARESLNRFWSRPFPPNYAHQIFFLMRDASQAARQPHASYSFARAGTELLTGWTDPLVVGLNWSNTAALAQAAGYSSEAAILDAKAEKAFSQAREPRVASRYRASATLFNATVMSGTNDAGRTKDAASVLGALNDLGPEVEQAERDDLLATLCWKANRIGQAETTATRLMEHIRRAFPDAGRDTARIVTAIRRSSAAGILASIRLTRDHDCFEAFRIWQGLSMAGVASTPAELSRGIGDVAYLTWADLPGGPVLWVLDAAGLDCYRLGYTAAKLRARAGQLHRQCEHPGSDTEAAGRDLFHRVMGGAEARLRSQRTLVIEAAGLLDAVPWAVIAPRETRLVLSFGLAEYQARAGTPPIDRSARMVLFSSPAVSSEMAALYPELAEAASEGDDVAGYFQRVARFTGPDASTISFRREAASGDLFHFSGHGSAAGQGALVLAPDAPDRPYSGLVTADVIGGQDWSRCKLAVLSACATAPTGGAQRESIVRALLDRGASRVVASLWNVDAAATRQLMTRFYARLAAGEEPSSALLLAQGDLRVNPATADPHYWAGFQLYGFR